MNIESNGYIYPIPDEAEGEVVMDRDFSGSAIIKDEKGRRFRVYGGKVKAPVVLAIVPDTAEVIDIAKPKRKRKKKS